MCNIIEIFSLYFSRAVGAKTFNIFIQTLKIHNPFPCQSTPLFLSTLTKVYHSLNPKQILKSKASVIESKEEKKEKFAD